MRVAAAVILAVLAAISHYALARMRTPRRMAEAAGKCAFSALEPTGSALVKKPGRTEFPIFGKNGDREFIDKTGQRVSPRPPTPASDGLTPFREFVDGHPRYGYRDAAGHAKIAPRFLDAEGFASHLAGVEDPNGLWGFIDETGLMRIEPRFQGVDNFSDGLAAVDLCERCSYIDAHGNEVVHGPFRHCYRFSDGVAKVELSEGRFGFIDKDGKVLASLSSGGEFQLLSDGLMASEKPGSGVGFVDRSGVFVIAPRYAFVQPFSEELAAVKEDELWGYIDKQGKTAIAPAFCDPEDPRGGYFQEGLAFVCDPKTKLYGFIGRDGKYVISPRYQRCQDPWGDHCGFDGGLAWVETKLLEGYINPEGRFVWSVSVGQGRADR
ncbi:MAG TPA: WG repeat-containing protein [Bryobacteraceae bacterium]|jgi:hypothetical protein|nr:WG repeat-containing protein [Bryobacteraceae bacterium]